MACLLGDGRSGKKDGGNQLGVCCFSYLYSKVEVGWRAAMVSSEVRNLDSPSTLVWNLTSHYVISKLNSFSISRYRTSWAFMVAELHNH